MKLTSSNEAIAITLDYRMATCGGCHSDKHTVYEWEQCKKTGRPALYCRCTKCMHRERRK